ncbi:hypothetical protein BDZ91DRAFT_653450 [Kalaharituber pfeilii]|nr:hypothetical protein BDZ91DRAFT_653450 [Kalaharituber pfeilii]
MPETVSPLSPATIAARPASERVLKLLAKGFEDVNRCIVGLPVVGHIDGSLSFGSVHGSIDHTQNPPNVKPSEGATNGQEMLRKPIDAHDSSITEVVSKVGRYWYTRTYERVITGAKGEAMGRSMWMDKGLLRECAKKKTGIRMLVAYARKASVPITQAGVKPTLKLMVPESVSKVADDAANSAITSSSMTVPFKLDVSQSSRPVITNQIKRCNVSERRVAFQD